MDVSAMRARLQAEGIAVTAHRDGTFTAGIMKPRQESWSKWVLYRVGAFPGVIVTLVRERPAADPYFAHNEVRFRLGPVPETLNAPQRACSEGAWYPTPSAATSAESADGTGKSSSAPAHREDATAGRDRPSDISLGTRPEFFHSVTAQQLDTEGPNHEVEEAEGAVVPARTCVSPGRRPGSVEGPGRVSPGGMVGREQGRAA